MILRILNNEEITRWINERVGQNIYAIKGSAPIGATYDDGELIERDINIGWRDMITGEEIKIIYARGIQE